MAQLGLLLLQQNDMIKSMCNVTPKDRKSHEELKRCLGLDSFRKCRLMVWDKEETSDSGWVKKSRDVAINV